MRVPVVLVSGVGPRWLGKTLPERPVSLPVLSMTAFGRAEGQDSQHQLVVEVRTLNHRSLQWKGRFPPHCQKLEEATDRLLHRRLTRGVVQLSLTILHGEDQPGLVFHEELAALYLQRLEGLAERFGYAERPSLEYLLALPGVLERVEPELDDESLAKLYTEVLDRALDQVLEGRRREGQALATELQLGADRIEACVDRIEARLPEILREYQERLERRIREYLQSHGHAVEELDLLREVAIFADRSDIGEELTRLRTHLVELRRILGQGGILGRRLDFLAQEMLREVNTTGSKSSDALLAHEVVEAKAELERIKEQSQNIE